MRKVEQNVEVECVNETEGGKVCLEVGIEKPINRAKARRGEHAETLEKAQNSSTNSQ